MKPFLYAIIFFLVTTYGLYSVYNYYEEIEVENDHMIQSSQWKNISDCGCEDGGKTLYPHPQIPELSGECLTCPRPMHPSPHLRQEKMAFALAFDAYSEKRVLVLIASIHRYYPNVPILVYEYKNLREEITLDRNVSIRRLLSIRNLVVVFNRQLRKMLDLYHDSQLIPFFIQEAMSRYSKVFWVHHGLEFTARKTIEQMDTEEDSLIQGIGSEHIPELKDLGFSKYFPTYQLIPTNYSVVLYKEGAKPIVNWLVECAMMPDCWHCHGLGGEILDCFPYLLSRLSVDYRIPSFPLKKLGAQKQVWEPPYCDSKCVAYVIGSVIVVLILVISFVLVLFNRTIQKRK